MKASLPVQRVMAKVFAFVLASLLGSQAGNAAPTTQYDSGDPTAQEQYMLELVNSARANPAAEGQFLASCTDPNVLVYYKYYGISGATLISQFASYPAQPPLAMNADLLSSSRAQSQYQASTGVQSHIGSGGSEFFQRIDATGYSYSAAAENVYAYVYNPLFGHVGLNADWGVPTLDHRINIMNYSGPVYKEIGIGFASTTIQNFGPLVVTQDFATATDSGQSFLVGVVYNDANGNNFYDQGEGLAGVTITPDQGDYYAVTSSSGGYVIPLPAGATTLTVTASGGGLGAARVKTITLGDQNVKLDFTSQDPVAPAAATEPTFFSNAVPIAGSGGWNYLAGFGFYNTNNMPVIYHDGLGFLYYLDAADGKGGAYFYDFTSQAWRYSTPALFPYLYDFGSGDWFYYFQGTSSPRVFANLGTGQIVNQ